jgi:hypothetical protein
LPFCTNCGLQVKDTERFCRECGTTLTKKTETKSITPSLSLDNEKVRKYSDVLSYFLDKHIEAMTNITKELVPYFDSLIVFEENNIVSVGNTWWVAESSPELLLYRMPLASKTDNVYSLDNLAKYTDREIIDDTVINLPKKFHSLVETYRSTLDAMEAIHEATKPIRAFKEIVDRLFKKEDLKNINTLQKYNEYIKDFLDNLENINWGNYPSGGLDDWLKKADKYGLSAGIFEGDNSKMACPYSNDLGIETDVERCMISYFSGIQSIQTAYNECRAAFLECTNRRGLFGGISGDLKAKTIEKLTYLNMYVNSLFYAFDYCNDKSAFFESSLKQFLNEDDASIIISDEKSMKNIFNIISILNGMYPTNMKWGPVVFQN